MQEKQNQKVVLVCISIHINLEREEHTQTNKTLINLHKPRLAKATVSSPLRRPLMEALWATSLSSRTTMSTLDIPHLQLFVKYVIPYYSSSSSLILKMHLSISCLMFLDFCTGMKRRID